MSNDEMVPFNTNTSNGLMNPFDFFHNNIINPIDIDMMIPKIGIKMNETDTHYNYEIDVPGVPRQNLKVKRKGDFIEIEGEKESIYKNESGEGFFSESSSNGSISRSFNLPHNADKNKIKLKLRNGILKIEIEKKNIKTYPKEIIDIPTKE